MNRQPLDLSHIEVIDDGVAAILRTKTPAERVEMALAANRGMRILIEAGLRKTHPGWSDAAIKAEIARLFSAPDE